MSYNLDTETEDLFFDGKFKIIQKKLGYRYNIDSFILADFFNCPNFTSVVDLGCGCGIIAFLLAGLYNKKVHGIELQHSLAKTAKRNVSLNNISELVNISNMDVKNVGSFFKEGSFDAAISNPPFYPTSSGRINTNTEKAIARHETALTAEELLQNAWYLLKKDGVFTLIYPYERSEEIINICDRQGFYVDVMRPIKTTHNKPPKTIMMRLIKNRNTKKTKIISPILVHENNQYTREILDIFKLFGANIKGSFLF